MAKSKRVVTPQPGHRIRILTTQELQALTEQELEQLHQALKIHHSHYRARVLAHLAQVRQVAQLKK